MLSSYAFQCFHPPLLPPSLSKIRVQTSPTHFSFNGIFQSNFKLTNKKRKFSCFRHEGFSPETPKSEYIDHFLPEEQNNLSLTSLVLEKETGNHLFSRLQMQFQEQLARGGMYHGM